MSSGPTVERVVSEATIKAAEIVLEARVSGLTGASRQPGASEQAAQAKGRAWVRGPGRWQGLGRRGRRAGRPGRGDRHPTATPARSRRPLPPAAVQPGGGGRAWCGQVAGALAPRDGPAARPRGGGAARELSPAAARCAAAHWAARLLLRAALQHCSRHTWLIHLPGEQQSAGALAAAAWLAAGACASADVSASPGPLPVLADLSAAVGLAGRQQRRRSG